MTKRDIIAVEMSLGPNEGAHLKPQEEGVASPFDLGTRVTCRLPRCLAARQALGQNGGRFLFSYFWTEDSIVIQLPCAACGATHSIELRMPA